MADKLPSTPQELAHVLAMLGEPDTNTVKHASDIMKNFMQNPESVAALMQQIQEAPTVQTRQMAAVLLRRKVAAHWKKLPIELREGTKQTLLARLYVEENNLVRMSLAALISILAQKLITDSGELWGELLEFLLKCSESQNESHREVAMVLFRALAENIGQHLKPHFNTLQGIFVRGLQDSHDAVKIEALRALSVLVEYLDTDEEVDNFKAVVHPMVESVKYFVSKDDEEAAAVAFEAFDNLAESGAPVLFDQLQLLVPMMADVMMNKNIDVKIRDKAAMFVSSLIENKPGKIVKHDFVPLLLNCCFTVLIEPVEDPEEEFTAEKIGIEVLDALANHTPKQVVFNHCMGHAAKMLQEQNPVCRRAGLMIIASLAEGLAEMMVNDLPQLIEAAVRGAQDNTTIVRNAAVEAIIMMADHLQPDILEYHEQILPACLTILDNTSEKVSVKKRVCIAVDAFCGELDASVMMPYIDPLMKRMTLLLHTGEEILQQTAISAIKSCATAAKEAFKPYFPDLLQMMGQLMSQTDDKMLDLRAEATECTGAMIAAVGKETAAPLLNDIFTLVGEGMNLNYFHLREASHNFFAYVANLLEADFEPYLMTVMTYLLAACASDDGLDLKESGAFNNYDVYDDEEKNEGSDEEVEAEGRYMISIRSGAIEEKLAALNCIGQICSAVGKPVIPYLAKIVPELVQVALYPYAQVRQHAMGVCRDVISLLAVAYPPAETPKPGVVTPLHPDVHAMLFGEDDMLMEVIIGEMVDEDDKQAVALACEALYECMKRFGLAAIQPKIDEVYKAVVMLIDESSPCQQTHDEDDPEAADHDEILMDSVTDIIGMIAQVVGPTFEPIFKSMFASIAKFVQPHRAESDRSMAIGCYAEVCEAIGDRSHDYFDNLLPIVSSGLKDPSIQVRRNSSFCLGVLVELGGPKLFRMHNQFLDLLVPNLELPGDVKKKNIDSAVASKENAASAICKMIMLNSGGLPVAKLLPGIFKCCPLTSDLSEAKSVYNCIMFLFSSQTQLMTSYLPDMINIFASALQNGDVDETLRMNIAAFCKSLQQAPQVWDVVQQTLGQLSPEMREAFVQSVAAIA